MDPEKKTELNRTGSHDQTEVVKRLLKRVESIKSEVDDLLNVITSIVQTEESSKDQKTTVENLDGPYPLVPKKSDENDLKELTSESNCEEEQPLEESDVEKVRLDIQGVEIDVPVQKNDSTVDRDKRGVGTNPTVVKPATGHTRSSTESQLHWVDFKDFFKETEKHIRIDIKRKQVKAQGSSGECRHLQQQIETWKKSLNHPFSGTSIDMSHLSNRESKRIARLYLAIGDVFKELGEIEAKVRSGDLKQRKYEELCDELRAVLVICFRHLRWVEENFQEKTGRGPLRINHSSILYEYAIKRRALWGKETPYYPEFNKPLELKEQSANSINKRIYDLTKVCQTDVESSDQNSIAEFRDLCLEYSDSPNQKFGEGIVDRYTELKSERGTDWVKEFLHTQKCVMDVLKLLDAVNSKSAEPKNKTNLDSVTQQAEEQHPALIMKPNNSSKLNLNLRIQDLKNIKALFEWLSNDYREAKLGNKDMKAAGNRLKGKTGLRYVPSQSKTTVGKRGRAYETMIDGKKYPLTEHVNSTTSSYMYRVAWCWDAKRSKVIVGFIGSHQ